MKNQITEDKIRQVAQKIVKQFQPEKIILFGSCAWGKPGPDSDVDLFVIKKTDNTRELAREISRAIFPRPFPIDFVVARPEQFEKRKRMGDFFINDIVSKGKVLYG